MDKVIFYAAPLFFVVLILLAVVAVRAPKKRIKDENGLVPIFEETCGGRINSFNYTWPLVRHSIYDTFVVIRCLGSVYVLPREELSIESSDGRVSSGIQYTSSNYLSGEFRIWTTDKKECWKYLQKMHSKRISGKNYRGSLL